MIRLRPATFDDAETLFDWRNAPDVRAVSLTSAPLDWPAHVAWLTRALADPDREVRILEKDGAAVGTLRLDSCGDRVEVSILLAPEARGQGIARAALQMAMAGTALDGVAFRATIRPENAASLALFQSLGFETVDTTDPIVMERPMAEKTPQEKIIDEIEAVRTRNNKNWMDILRLAFRHAPDEAAAVLKEIYKEDKAISDLAQKLTGPQP